MGLWDQMLSFGKSWFSFPGVEWTLILVAIGIALAFGAIWLTAHWPPLFRYRWLWAVGIFSAFFTLAAIMFVQIPLQYGFSRGLGELFDNDTLRTWLLLTGLPSVLASGFVQEAAKMVPMIVWKRWSGRSITPAMGLAIGAIAGAGFGIFEAFWGISSVFRAGWTTAAIQADGFMGIAPFWERFFAIAFHIGASALVGYGLAKGKLVKFFIIAALLHSVLNYSSLIYQHWYLVTGGMLGGYIAVVEMETYIAVVAVLVTAFVMLLRWSRRFHEPDDELPADTVTLPPGETAVIEPVEKVPAPTE